MPSIVYKRANTNKELLQILELQRKNYSKSISTEELAKEGFVTVRHDFEILKRMNDKCAHILAKHDENLVGYALCMIKDFKNDIEVLQPMFKQIEQCINQNQTYIVMGQICIEKMYRKQGIFRGLYEFMKKELLNKFDLIITEVDVTNSRSLKAHYAIGFEKLQSYQSNNQQWEIISYH